MISRVTGEVHFEDLLEIQPLERLPFSFAERYRFPLEGWTVHDLEIHISDRGIFDVLAVTDSECRVRLVWLSHHHPGYGFDIDDERREFHEGIIAADLGGQREFSWGACFCLGSSRDYLIVAYSTGLKVPLREYLQLCVLFAREGYPFTPVPQVITDVRETSRSTLLSEYFESP